jgi:hypothetical protein
MPEAEHRKLNAAARRKFGTTTSKRAKAYVYSTLRKIKERRAKKYHG